MNPLYEKAKDLILIRRTPDNKEFEEYPLILQPQSILVTDPINNVVCFPFCGLQAVSASYAQSASWAPSTPSNLSVSASWASQSLSASWAPLTSTITQTSCSWASQSLSASYASASLSASYAENASTASLANTVITTGVTDGNNYSVALVTPDSIHSVEYDGNVLFTYTPNTETLYVSNIQATVIAASNVTASLFGTASWALNSVSTSYASTASYSITAFVTSSTNYQSSASWASSSLSASVLYGPHASIDTDGAAILRSVYGFDGSNNHWSITADGTADICDEQLQVSSTEVAFIGASVRIDLAGNVTASGFNGPLIGTASYANKALSASYAQSASYATSASWVSSSVSASYARSASWASQSLSASYTLSASYVQSASYATSASWVSSSVSASYALTASYSLSSSIAETASYAMNSEDRSNYMPYEMVYTSSTSWITCSFAISSQYVNLSASAAVISFTSSNNPTVGYFADIILFVSNSMVTAPALSFPDGWLCMNGLWPLSITVGSSAIIWLRGYDSNKVIGTYHENLV